jgi:hypothetical protein
MLLLVPAAQAHGTALPPSTWWLVVHDQCADTLHWINSTGEYASIPRPRLPNEAAPSVACSFKPLHISQNGRYLVETALLSNGKLGVGFYDLQAGQFLNTYEAQPDEGVYVGNRYSSDAVNHIAVGFANSAAATWRVVLFDMTTGSMVDELRSNGTEIAGFVGAEFLATTPTIPQVVLLAEQEEADQIHIRFDGIEPGTEPFGAAVWYPQGAPGVEQELVSGPYTEANIDVLPDGRAILAYASPDYPAGPSPEGLIPITTNSVGMQLPAAVGDFAALQFYFADGISTLYNAQWGADGEVALFRRFADNTSQLFWIKVGTSVLTPLENEAAQVIGVPGGFLYNAGENLYFLDANTGTATGPILTDPMFSGSAAFVWATAFGNPALELDELTTAGPIGPMIVTATPQTPIIATIPVVITATPDNGICRLTSADRTNINVRSGPSTDYPTLGQMNGSAELAITGYNGQWYVVNFNGVQGWMASWVTTLHGNCGSLALVAAPPLPPTAVPATAQIQFWADNTNLTAGACTDIHWQVENIREVYFDGTGVTGSGIQHVCPAATTTYTLQVTLTDGTAQTRTVTITVGGGGGGGQPDLYISEMSIEPATPAKGQAVNVRVGVYNQGTAAVSGSFHIVWYPGENYPSPACNWDLDGMSAHGGRILTCTYAGYPSPYGSINMLASVDTNGTIAESDETNNSRRQAISVTN